MKLLFAIWLLAASSRIDLVDEVFFIPAAQWRYVEIPLRQKPAFIQCEYSVMSGGPAVRLILIHREDLSRFRNARRHETLALSLIETKGRMGYQALAPGDYVLIVDNRMEDRLPAKVQVRIALDFAPQIGYVSPRRQLIVILLSFAVFFGIVTYSARKLLRNIKS